MFRASRYANHWLVRQQPLNLSRRAIAFARETDDRTTLLGRRAALHALLALSAQACRTTSNKGSLRVVSLSASTTETLFALGAGHEVVGRSRFCDFPEEVAALPEVGGFVDPSLERILALAPTLVAGSQGPLSPAFVEAIRSRGIATYFPRTESFDEIVAMIEGLGKAVGRDGQPLSNRLRAARASLSARLQPDPTRRPSVLLVFGKHPFVAAGPTGFPNEMLAIAGGRNVLTSGDAYPTLSLERVLRLAPDLLIDAEMGPPSPWPSQLHPLRDRMRVVRDVRVLRPGPRVMEGAEVLATLLASKP